MFKLELSWGWYLLKFCGSHLGGDLDDLDLD
jgi:hypothetical protein